MTDWYAVAVGFVVSLVAGAVGFAVPGVGHVGAGLVGGFVAGYLAGGGLGRGAWHGFLAGAIGGIVLAVLFGLLGAAIGLGAGPLGSLFGGAGVFLVAAAIAFLLAVDSLIAGALGGWLKAR